MTVIGPLARRRQTGRGVGEGGGMEQWKARHRLFLAGGLSKGLSGPLSMHDNSPLPPIFPIRGINASFHGEICPASDVKGLTEGSTVQTTPKCKTVSATDALSGMFVRLKLAVCARGSVCLQITVW